MLSNIDCCEGSCTIKDYGVVVWGMVIFITLLSGFVPHLQVTFFALLEDFYLGRLDVKDRDKTPRITGMILITFLLFFCTYLLLELVQLCKCKYWNNMVILMDAMPMMYAVYAFQMPLCHKWLMMLCNAHCRQKAMLIGTYLCLHIIPSLPGGRLGQRSPFSDISPIMYDTDQRDPNGVLAQSFTAIDGISKIAKENSIWNRSNWSLFNSSC
jgi:hypothetical protein